MNKRFVFVILFFGLLSVAAALMLAYRAATLEGKLMRIDEETQCRRLVELSLPRVQAKLDELLGAEQRKLGKAPDVAAPFYAMPEGGMADFNRGFFMQSPLESAPRVPRGQEAFRAELARAGAITNTIRRKAYVPDASVMDPADEPGGYDPSSQMPVFSTLPVDSAQSSEPLELTGDPGEFFAWHYKDWLVCMRSVPTSEGCAAEGFVIDVPKLVEHLRPEVAAELPAPQIGLPQAGEEPNLKGLPLVLRSGGQVNLSDSGQRAAAMRSTINTAWAIALLSILIIFALLVLYARMERRRSDFVSAVTHELRTPLTSFSLYTEMLKDGRVPPEKVADYHETLFRESGRLAHLVENVLSFARLSRGKVRGRQDAGPCTKLLDPVFARVGERLKASGFRFTITQDPRMRLLSLRTDLISLEQVLNNLADNAIKYGDRSRRNEEASAKTEPAVSISLLQTHRSLSIRFSDNGPGMSEAARRTLFQPFSRSAEAEKGRKSGVGLGLAISRDLMRSIGGDLELERGDASGCTFLLTLPLGE